MTAKFNLLLVTAIPAIAFAPLFACGGGSDKTPDAAMGSGSGSGSGPGSGSGSGSNNVCLLPASLGTIDAFTADLVRYRAGSASGSGHSANRLSIVGALDANDTEEVTITIYGGCGTGSGCTGRISSTPDWPALFGPKSGIDVTQAVDVRANAAGGVGSNSVGAFYAFSAGTLDVTDAKDGSGSAGSGAIFNGTISNATLVHIDIGSAGAMPDPDGCTSAITSLTFTGASFTGKPLLRHRYTEQ